MVHFYNELQVNYYTTKSNNNKTRKETALIGIDRNWPLIEGVLINKKDDSFMRDIQVYPFIRFFV